MLILLAKEFKKFVRTFIETIRFRWRVLIQGGYAGRSLFVKNQQFIHIGKKVRIKSGYRIECYSMYAGVKLSPKIIIDDGVIIGNFLTILGGDTVVIGTDTILASNVTLISENHGMDPESKLPYYAQPLATGPISIGDGCWIGQNVSVLPNVKIGRKCIIATNSVVTKNIPDYSIAAGIPAKVLKKYNFETNKWESIIKSKS